MNCELSDNIVRNREIDLLPCRRVSIRLEILLEGNLNTASDAARVMSPDNNTPKHVLSTTN